MHTQLIDALRSPAPYPRPVDEVELIETHISWVFLAGGFVYKLKKPLDLGFLDFSTLEKRRFYCEEEIRLNRRTAPEIYLDVIGIGGTPESPRLAGDDDPIEYAVRMRRFDVDAGFDHLLADDRLEQEHVVDLGRQLAQLHHVAEPASPDGRFGDFESVADPMRDNFKVLNDMLEGESVSDALASLEKWTENQLEQFAPLLETRRRDGWIRECHGDAHLGNVALIDGCATLFDCIEFSEDLRWIDVVSDLAFTVMDLRDRGAYGFAWLLLDEYLAHSGDYQGIELLPLYMVYRALVRAKVNAFRLEDADADRPGILEEIQSYLGLAEKIAGEERAAIVITMGVSGSGKSWLARRLVARAGLVRMRSDVERKRLHGLDPEDSSDSGIEADLYSAEATERTYHGLVELAEPLIRAGIPALIDAACLKQWQRAIFRDLARECEVPFAIVHCQTDQRILEERIERRAEAGDDPSEAGLEVLAHQKRSMEPLAEHEQADALILDTAEPDSTRVASDWITTRLSHHD